MIPQNTTKLVYDLSNLEAARKNRLAKILEVDGLYSSAVATDFTRAVYYPAQQVWHFYNSDGMHPISEIMLHSIGTRLDAQAEFDQQVLGV